MAPDPIIAPVAAPSLSNAEIADRFELLGDLLELEGAVVYRVLAYRRAAKTLRETPESVVRLSAEGKLVELPNIGATINDKVTELLATGHIAALDKVVDRNPPGAVAVMRVPGIGPKTARKIFSELQISTVDEALQAARDGRIRDLPGMGEKTELLLIEGLEGQPVQGRARVSVARLRPLAEQVVESLSAVPGVEACEIAGSLRRYAETAKDIDIVCASSSPREVIDAFAALDWVSQVESRGDAKATCVAHDGSRVELRIVDPECFGNLLAHLTGSKAHNVALRESAVRRKLSISEYGITDTKTGEVTRSADEEGVYARLGLPWIPPELRENRGEIEAAKAGKLPDLVRLDQIRGDLHSHTDWTDGKATLEVMVEAARAKGYSYLNITDHSPAVGFGMGLDADRLRAQIERVRALDAAQTDGFRVLVGTEVDILKDGSLDYPDELLAELDVVVASPHASHRLNADGQTKRICAAIENPHVDIIGHPTARKIGLREGYPIHIEAVVEAAAANGTVLEVNAQPDRLDLRDTSVRLAVEAGVKLSIDTDAHSVAALDYMRFGVMNARRGWATADDVVNTREWPELRKLLRKGG
jgi:DNA polymerase (family X)